MHHLPSYRALALSLAVAGLTGCTAIFGLDEKTVGSLGTDAGSLDATSKPDATPVDATGTKDAASPCTTDDAGFHDVHNLACWETWKVPVSFDSAAFYAGGSFDGRYLYFASNINGIVAQYDSTKPFSDSTSWDEHPLTNADGQSAIAGVVFDGRYMYFIPDDSSSTFWRFDTTMSFDDSASWHSFVFNAAHPEAFIAYQGGTFDGRYVYFAPYEDEDENSSSVVARYDTQAAFDVETSWSSFDTLTISSASNPADAFHGAIFDGRYVYFVPEGDDGSVIATRYDTTGVFKAATSWSTFDTTTLDSSIVSFSTGTFDGTYVTFVPTYASQFALQYDPTKPFAEKASWTKHNPAPGSGEIGSGDTPTFGAAGFDGRSIYFAPNYTDDGNDGLMLEHLASASFDDATSWSTFETTDVKAYDFGAVVFDGQYLYFAPGGAPYFARFDARATPLQPPLPHYFGSFY
jgi:hypothetical protein